MSSALYCMLFGILVFFPETDAGDLTWNEPLPVQTVPDNNPIGHFGKKELHKGKINATVRWRFALSDLSFDSLSIFFGGQNIAGVRPQAQEPLPGFENQFGINWIASQNLVTLVIFNVTTEVNGTFTCRVRTVRGAGTFTFSSNVQVNVVAPPSNIVTSGDQTKEAPAKLSLDCSADGIPKPTYTWTRVSDNTVVTMPLNITGGKDAGSYRCTAKNGVGSPLYKDVKVNVLFSAKVTVEKKSFVGREHNASLMCRVEGNPKPTISWSGCDLPNHLCDKQYLYVSKVQIARANYTCTASNYLGNDSATTVLVIGGNNVYVRVSVSGECKNKDSVLETLKSKLSGIFANTGSYIETQPIDVSCRSRIFDLVLKFNTEFAEDDTISIIQNAIVDGKFGELSLNVSYIIGIPPVEQTTSTAPTSTTPKSEDNKTGVIIAAVVGSVASVGVIVFVIWYVRKKKCCSETKEVSDNTDAGQGRKGKGPNGADEVAYASTSMLSNSKRPVGKANQSTVEALPMYAQVDKTKKTSNKGGAAQRQRQPGELQYAEVEHVTSGRSLPRKSSSEPIKPSNEEIVYADLV